LRDRLGSAAGGAGGGRCGCNGTAYAAFAASQSGTGEDPPSPFADPLLRAPGAADFPLGSGSPAINAGDPAFVPGAGETDLDGGTRVNGPRVDIGAGEVTICGNGGVETPEACDARDPGGRGGRDSKCKPHGR